MKTGRCLIVAEVAQAHDGSLGLAHAFVDAVAGAGADVVKFQTHIASAESTSLEPWRVRFSAQDATRYDYWRRMEFTEEQWRGLRKHAESRGVLFASSPFSVEAVELLQRVGVAYWKVPSGEIGSLPMLERILETGLPVVLSSGMSSLEELDRAVERVKRFGVELTVLQCTSLYPCPPEKIGLNLVPLLRDRYDCAVGLSDHSGTIYPSLAAATLGSEMLEVHVTLSRDMFGPDVAASITSEELKALVEGVRFIEIMNSQPVSKDQMADELRPVRDTFTKSIVARSALPAGTVLREEHLTLKKPGTGIAADRIPGLLGRTLRRSLAADEMIEEVDLC